MDALKSFNGILLEWTEFDNLKMAIGWRVERSITKAVPKDRKPKGGDETEEGNLVERS